MTFSEGGRRRERYNWYQKRQQLFTPVIMRNKKRTGEKIENFIKKKIEDMEA